MLQDLVKDTRLSLSSNMSLSPSVFLGLLCKYVGIYEPLEDLHPIFQIIWHLPLCKITQDFLNQESLAVLTRHMTKIFADQNHNQYLIPLAIKCISPIYNYIKNEDI